jgi:hypothetical protein
MHYGADDEPAHPVLAALNVVFGAIFGLAFGAGGFFLATALPLMLRTGLPAMPHTVFVALWTVCIAVPADRVRARVPARPRQRRARVRRVRHRGADDPLRRRLDRHDHGLSVANAVLHRAERRRPDAYPHPVRHGHTLDLNARPPAPTGGLLVLGQTLKRNSTTSPSCIT